MHGGNDDEHCDSKFTSHKLARSNRWILKMKRWDAYIRARSDHHIAAPRLTARPSAQAKCSSVPARTRSTRPKPILILCALRSAPSLMVLSGLCRAIRCRSCRRSNSLSTRVCKLPPTSTQRQYVAGSNIPMLSLCFRASMILPNALCCSERQLPKLATRRGCLATSFSANTA